MYSYSRTYESRQAWRLLLASNHLYATFQSTSRRSRNLVSQILTTKDQDRTKHWIHVFLQDFLFGVKWAEFVKELSMLIWLFKKLRLKKEKKNWFKILKIHEIQAKFHKLMKFSNNFQNRNKHSRQWKTWIKTIILRKMNSLEASIRVAWKYLLKFNGKHFHSLKDHISLILRVEVLMYVIEGIKLRLITPPKSTTSTPPSGVGVRSNGMIETLSSC